MTEPMTIDVERLHQGNNDASDPFAGGRVNMGRALYLTAFSPLLTKYLDALHRRPQRASLLGAW